MNSSNFDAFASASAGDSNALGPARSWSDADTFRLLGHHVPAYTAFLSTTARTSYNHGLIRFLLPDSKPSLFEWNSPKGLFAGWPRYAGFFVVFAFDWQGNSFGFDLRAAKGKEPSVRLLETGFAKMLSVFDSFGDFVNRILVEEPDAALCASFYRSWLATAPQPLAFNRCVRYQHPLHLGGQDELENLAEMDLDVYVTLTGQLWERAS